jgi:hypothetical protein
MGLTNTGLILPHKLSQSSSSRGIFENLFDSFEDSLANQNHGGTNEKPEAPLIVQSEDRKTEGQATPSPTAMPKYDDDNNDDEGHPKLWMSLQKIDNNNDDDDNDDSASSDDVIMVSNLFILRLDLVSDSLRRFA